jgi:hypothetical protein
MAALLASALVLVALCFGSDVIEGFLKPTAAAIWALLRIFVLSVDQIKLWAFMALAAALLAIVRAATAIMDASQGWQAPADEADENALAHSIRYWRYLLSEAPSGRRDIATTRNVFIRLLISARAAKERVAGDFTLRDDFQARRIPLPDEVYGLLFAEEPRSRRTRLRAWLDRATGRDRAEYHRAVALFFEYLESYMEIKDEN